MIYKYIDIWDNIMSAIEYQHQALQIYALL